jgi:predicted nucleic acid-binding protein
MFSGKKVRRGELTKAEADVATQTLEQADVTLVSTRRYLARAAAIAVELDHPVYDAMYLAVAEASGLRLVTADERLVHKLREGRNRFREILVPRPLA